MTPPPITEEDEGPGLMTPAAFWGGLALSVACWTGIVVAVVRYLDSIKP